MDTKVLAVGLIYFWILAKLVDSYVLDVQNGGPKKVEEKVEIPKVEDIEVKVKEVKGVKEEDLKSRKEVIKIIKTRPVGYEDHQHKNNLSEKPVEVELFGPKIQGAVLGQPKNLNIQGIIFKPPRQFHHPKKSAKKIFQKIPKYISKFKQSHDILCYINNLKKGKGRGKAKEKITKEKILEKTENMWAQKLVQKYKQDHKNKIKLALVTLGLRFSHMKRKLNAHDHDQENMAEEDPQHIHDFDQLKVLDGMLKGNLF